MSEKNFENPYARPGGGAYVPSRRRNVLQVMIAAKMQVHE